MSWKDAPGTESFVCSSYKIRSTLHLTKPNICTVLVTSLLDSKYVYAVSSLSGRNLRIRLGRYPGLIKPEIMESYKRDYLVELYLYGFSFKFELALD